MDIRAILFDKDGTLADFAATFNPATGRVIEHICEGDQALMERVASVWGFDRSTGQIRDDSVIVAGSGLEITSALQSVMEVGNLEEYNDFLDRLFGEICRETVEAISGIESTLKRLHSEKYVLGVATNDSEENAITQMETLGLDHLFSIVYGANSGHGPKPEPGMVNAFVEHVQLDVSQVLMVGDSTHDLEAGRAAGVLTCGVETGPATRNELHPHADVVLSSVTDLPKWLADSM